jgi:hypothetical protein
MRLTIRFLIAYRAAAAAFLLPMSAAAQDKTGFTILDPTPSALMRPLATDRPMLTDGPFTVDAGHVQVEFDGWNQVRETAGGAGNTQTSYGALNARIGLTNDAELQVMLNPIRNAVKRDARGIVVAHNNGLATMTTRLKLNVFGNDDGNIAFAVLPYVTVPTNSTAAGTHAVTGGLSLPLAFKLDDAWSLGLMTKLDVPRNGADTHYTPTFVNGASVAYAVTGSLSTYAEAVVSRGLGAGFEWQVTLDTGLMLALTKSIQLDAGINVGATRATPALNPFVGVSWRF